VDSFVSETRPKAGTFFPHLSLQEYTNCDGRKEHGIIGRMKRREEFYSLGTLLEKGFGKGMRGRGRVKDPELRQEKKSTN